MHVDSVLIVAAHPDDEVLGCGGTIARLAAEGCAVYVAILGEGITSRFVRREHAEQESVQALRAQSRRVAEFLGARDLFVFDAPDNRFDTVPLLDIVKMLESVVERISPQCVYTQHGGDLNIDHALTYRATLTACRPVPGCPVRRVLAYEVGSSSEWAFSSFDPVFRPNVFMDVSATLARKIQALEMYGSEVRRFPHPRSPEAVRALARRWGSAAGLEAAEAFQLVRSTE